MNRKNTIIIAVLVNVGLLAILLITALTTSEEVIVPTKTVLQDTPKFEEPPLFLEPAPIVMAPEIPKPMEEPIIHTLPPLIQEVVVTPPAAATVVVVPPVNEVAVKKGDSLEKIAKVHHTTVDEIIKLNHLPSSFLKIGQVLKIPSEKTIANAPKVKPVEIGPEYYTMKVGENPWAIAMKHHMKVDELLRLNSLNEERARKLKPGDRLRIR